MIDSIKQKLAKLNPSQPTNLKKAGVLIAILHYDEYIDTPSIIYTQRSSVVSTHSGEVSFPGGMMEDIDIDLYQTALRESFEEMNLDPLIVPGGRGRPGGHAGHVHVRRRGPAPARGVEWGAHLRAGSPFATG